MEPVCNVADLCIGEKKSGDGFLLTIYWMSATDSVLGQLPGVLLRRGANEGEEVTGKEKNILNIKAFYGLNIVDIPLSAI